MNATITIRNILPDSNYTCFVIPSLFNKDECEQFLSGDIKTSFQKAISNYPTYYRNNDRLVIDDTDLSKLLFEKVRPYLPEVIETNSNIQSENGTWHLKELNDRLRFCKYSANQYFHRHLDGIHYRSEHIQSKLTFMIYLNSAGEFEGGRTLFYKTKETSEVWASYIPQQGDLIVFDHNVWHEGEVLTSGEKFVLRSDILYAKEETLTIQQPFAGHLGYIWALLKFDDDTILSGGRDKEIKVWNAGGEQHQSLKGHDNSILCIEKVNDNTIITGSRDQRIIVWQRGLGQDFRLSATIHVHSAVVLSLCRLTETSFVSSSGDNTVQVVNLDGSIVRTFTEHSNWVWKVIRLQEGIIATSSEDGTIKIWDIKLERYIQTFKEKSSVISLAFLEGSRQLISGNLEGEISVRTLTADFTEQDHKRYKAHDGIIRTIVHLGNKLIATGGEDNKIRIWDIGNQQLIRELEHDNFVQSIAVLDDRRFLSASYDGTIQSWVL